ncbi:MAG TPA: hypothetical protein VMU80_00285, partial [Bryobacteraceae bacterium]|nr:hypothetical protein [Bryobacteraceae bacterium]
MRFSRPVLLSLIFAVLAAAQALPPISYVVRIPEPLTHYAEVEARVPTGGQPHVELMMAVWTPYVIR